jgi:hypothetical protein
MGLCLPPGPQVPCHGVLVCVCMSGFFFFFFLKGSPELFAQGMLQTAILLISAY